MLIVIMLCLGGLFSSLSNADSRAYAEGATASIPKIADVGIFYTGTDTCLGYSTNPNILQASISAKGATIQFDSVIQWDDFSKNRNSSYVSWATSDQSVATVNSSGTLIARSDGTVQVKATVAGANTDTGVDRVATCWVKISGQSDARYVTGVRVTDSNGGVIGSESYELREDLSTAMAQFCAEVDVFNPANGQTQTYSTKNGLLSSQASDIGNLYWYVGDSSRAYVDPSTGQFRPTTYGVNSVVASSRAGLGGQTVSGSANVMVRNPDNTPVEEGYHPQSTFTVKVSYELYPPEQYGDEAYVTTKEYSADDLQALGTIAATYTALGSGGTYFTMTGWGTPLSSILADAGVRVSDIKYFGFGTADSIDRTVSREFIFDTNRYYYPNIDLGMYTGAKQVYPIIALKSNEVKNAGTDPNWDISEGTRFRLLFGSTPSGGTSQFQIKWINTLYVVMSGAPPVQNNENEDPDSKVAPETNGDPDGTSGLDVLAGNRGDSTATKTDNAAKQGTGGDTSSKTIVRQDKKFNIYQIMSKSESETDETLDFGNPVKQLAFPLGATVFIAGGAQSFVWYRRQSQMGDNISRLIIP